MQRSRALVPVAKRLVHAKPQVIRRFSNSKNVMEKFYDKYDVTDAMYVGSMFGFGSGIYYGVVKSSKEPFEYMIEAPCYTLIGVCAGSITGGVLYFTWPYLLFSSPFYALGYYLRTPK